MRELDQLLASELFDLCPDPIIGVDRRGTINLFNAAAEKLLGYRAEEIIGQFDAVGLYGDATSARAIKTRLWEEHQQQRQLRGWETELKSACGEMIPIRLSATLIMHEGEEIGSVGFFHDLTPYKTLQTTLETLSVTDELSGLFNHRQFHKQLACEVERCQRYQRPLSLLYFDLDSFKLVNDLHGHLQGDRVIRFLAEVMRKVSRTADCAYRYGGDEFALLAPETTLAQAQQLADRLRGAVDHAWPFSLVNENGDDLRVSLSIGVAQLDVGESAEQFLQRADAAMYQAKRAGGNRAHRANAVACCPAPGR